MNCRRLSTLALPLAITGVLCLAGCDDAWTLPPRSAAEFEVMPKDGPGNYPQRTVVLFNLQCLFDPGLPEDSRLSSFYLVERLACDDPEVRESLAILLDTPDTPADLGEELRRVLGVDRGEDPALAARD